MGRPITKIEALHGYKTDELIKLKITEGNKVVIFLDNAGMHKSLEVIFLPKYSPMMNPQEQV